MAKKLFLVDALALIFRAYYALIRSPRVTSKGKNTNAQFGFTNALIELLNNQKPSHIAVCFDTAAPTERHIYFEDYKANRQEAPEDLLAALPDIKRIIRALNIPVIEKDGFEADDIIGTLSRQASDAGYEVFMVTPDKDYGQLVNDKVFIYKPGYQGGDVEILGPKEVCEKWNINNVSQVIDMLGLMGDAVDNIPGIPGIGEKTATKLLAEYGTLENVLENADNIPGKLGEKIRDGKELAIMSKKLATGEDVLLKLASKHKIVDDILVFRELTKLKSTYADALPLMVNKKTGRVHTSFAQAVAVTGRLSSNNPNLQNIPVRTERGREIRKAFIPRDKDHVLLSADYSQIELRIVAAISGDPAMCDAFRNGKDIHAATAARIYNIDESEVTKEMRYKAKSVNFGIIYGQGAFGLAENLGISRGEAREIIDNYKKQFTGIQQYMDDTINFARQNGYVQTLMGRKRWLRDITSSNQTVRSFAERNAINSPIQGSAADMIKLAMIRLYEKLKEEKLKSKMILQVHDELVFDAQKDEVVFLKPLIVACMQNALPLPNNVPVVAEVGEGENWLEAH